MKTPKNTAGKTGTQKKSVSAKNTGAKITKRKNDLSFDHDDDDPDMPIDEGFDGLIYDGYDDDDDY